MATYYPALAHRVHSQREQQPAMYGGVDFDTQPYRTTTDPADFSALPQWVADRAQYLADEQAVELIATTTLLGDVVADPYAALMSQRSVTDLIELLQLACRKGIEAVDDAPPELVAFIAAMEVRPTWLDMDLVREGARHARIPAALVAPFVTRGAFIATFVNTYAALPMALTGALSGRRAARRVNETTSFFAVTTLPGALERYGPGFEAAAMVRLMHSMVRYNALKRSEKWDTDVYGIPVPQVDQMPAGMINLYLLAVAARRKGRTEFTASERAVVEFTRYRAFLLGLPEELLPTTPTDIIHLIHTRGALLREDFDDATCGAMVRSTMDAYLRPIDTRWERAADAVEKSYSKVAFTKTFCNGDRSLARDKGVTVGPADYLRIALTAPFIFGRLLIVRRLNRIPALRRSIDDYIVGLIKRRLITYGKPEFTSDVSEYTPTGKAS